MEVSFFLNKKTKQTKQIENSTFKCEYICACRKLNSSVKCERMERPIHKITPGEIQLFDAFFHFYDVNKTVYMKEILKIHIKNG